MTKLHPCTIGNDGEHVFTNSTLGRYTATIGRYIVPARVTIFYEVYENFFQRSTGFHHGPGSVHLLIVGYDALLQQPLEHVFRN